MTANLTVPSALLIAAAMLTLTACPLGSEPNEPANNDSTPDAGADADPQDDTGDPEDTGEADAPVTCVAQHASPQTLALGAAPTSVTWTLACDAELTPDALGDAITLTPAGEEATPLEVTYESVECDPDADVFVCALTLSGVELGDREAPGLVRFTLDAGDATARVDLALRAHVGAERLAELQRPRDLIALPEGYADRGIATRVAQTERGRVVSGSMWSEGGSSIDLFTVSPDGAVTVHTSIEAPAGRFSRTGLASRALGQGVDTMWWGFDPSTGSFVGASILVDADGADASVSSFDSSTYRGPALAKVADATVEVTTVAGAQRLSLLAVARTERDTAALVRAVTGEGLTQVSLERELDAFAGNAVAGLDSGRYGLLASADILTGADAPAALAWSIDRAGKLSVSPRAGDGASSVTLSGVGASDIVSLRRVGRHVLTHVAPESGAARVLVLPTDDKGELGDALELDLPAGFAPELGAFVPQGLSLIHI